MREEKLEEITSTVRLSERKKEVGEAPEDELLPSVEWGEDVEEWEESEEEEKWEKRNDNKKKRKCGEKKTKERTITSRAVYNDFISKTHAHSLFLVKEEKLAPRKPKNLLVTHTYSFSPHEKLCISMAKLSSFSIPCF